MHHAYLYEGSLTLLPELALEARSQFGFKKEHDPDVSVREYEAFGIEEARKLSETASLRSVSGRALFIIGLSGISVEAQQALLKLLEEPQQGVIFVLLAPHGMIIPTLRSRMMMYRKRTQGADQNSLVEAKPTRGLFESRLAEAFLKAAPKTRSDEIAKMLKDDEGLRDRVRDFLNALESELYARPHTDEKARAALKDISKVRSYAGDRSPSFKMLLEYLALCLPSIK
jgi:hypothetical protein